MENPRLPNGRIDITRERYDASTFVGRYKHFFEMCDPVSLLTPRSELEKAKDIYFRYKNGENLNLPDEDIWRQKLLYDTAFHPVSEQVIPHLGRMSAQCPVNGILVGAMLSFYSTPAQVVFWQWINQSFDAFVNTMNSSDPRIDWKETLKYYSMGVAGGLTVACTMATLAKGRGMLAQRLVPMFNVTVASCMNVALCRQNELREGVDVWFQEKEVAKSRKMGLYSIAATSASRVMMQAPHMLFLPMIMTRLAPFFKKHPKLDIPFQVLACTVSLRFSTPLGCSLFPHKTYVAVSSLEPDVQETIKKNAPTATEVYFNKGL